MMGNGFVLRCVHCGCKARVFSFVDFERKVHEAGLVCDFCGNRVAEESVARYSSVRMKEKGED